MIYLVHVLFVAPLLMYSGYIGYNNCSKENSGDQNVFFFKVYSLTVFLYHLFYFTKCLSLKNNTIIFFTYNNIKMFTNNYDIVIVGAGISGLFMAYKLNQLMYLYIIS